MSELYEQIVSERSKTEGWLERIPGFKGYVDNKASRVMSIIKPAVKLTGYSVSILPGS